MQWLHVLPSKYLKGTSFPRVHKVTKLEPHGVSEKTTLGTQIPTSSLSCFYPDPRQKPSRPLSGACLSSSHGNMVMSGPQLAAVQAVLGTDANRPQAWLSWVVLAEEAPFANVSKLGYYSETQQFSPAPRVGPPQEPACACALQLAFQGFPWVSLPLHPPGCCPLLPQCMKHRGEVNFVGLHNSSVLREGNDKRSETLPMSPQLRIVTAAAEHWQLRKETTRCLGV